ncbi:MAG: DinB family protein [Phycisphaerae bacterium]|nr:DinB family protein [Phycisphaerae bacterium]
MDAKQFVIEQMQMVRNMLLEWVKDIPEEQISTRAVDDGVHLAWILSHLAWSEAGTVNKFIRETENPLRHLGKSCGMHSTVVDEGSVYPSKDEALDTLEKVRANTLKFLDSLSEKDLDKLVEKAPPQFKTWGSIFALVPAHEAHHNGQISVIWRRLGHKPKI